MVLCKQKKALKINSILTLFERIKVAVVKNVKKLVLIGMFAFLVFSGCASFREIQGVNISGGVGGAGVTLPIGNGWQYTDTVNISNGIPGAVIDIFQDGKHIARLNEGGVLSFRVASSFCYGYYGYGGWYSGYPSWQSMPPEQSLHASIYKDGKFISSRDWKIRMHDCYRGIRQSDNWLIQ